ncbi:MAG TPA: hypothetical protein VFO05_16840, partial [Candidatus Limnocylindrales bacterium]|nr:hypothetical protein [Candidatus Limnocylindrales bacterium]
SDRASLLDRLTGGDAGPDEDPRVAQFVRGLAIGALVGAAIAGSTLLQRRRSAGQASARQPSIPATAFERDSTDKS